MLRKIIEDHNVDPDSQPPSSLGDSVHEGIKEKETSENGAPTDPQNNDESVFQLHVARHSRADTNFVLL